ncbi:MAG TPA: permease [Jatrophihabitans sp.]|nr:permease [Jatrophihabitans sp.]
MTRWANVLAAICVQAAPFVVLGALLSGCLRVAPRSWLRRWVPRRQALAVPALGLVGVALPGCECGSVPAAAGLIAGGVGAGPATAFMLSAPGANPVVLAATATAFPGRPGVVAARFVGALLLAACVGWLVSSGIVGHPRPPTEVSGGHTHAARDGPWEFLDAVTDEALRSLGLLSMGAAAAAAIVVLVPRGLLSGIAHVPVLSVFALALLATLMSICSQADAFIARSFTGFSTTAQLAFMILGPAVDLKLAAMQAGAFGARFSIRFAVATFAVGLGVACLVAAVIA